jgi:hypothetical protein
LRRLGVGVDVEPLLVLGIEDSLPTGRDFGRRRTGGRGVIGHGCGWWVNRSREEETKEKKEKEMDGWLVGR